MNKEEWPENIVDTDAHIIVDTERKTKKQIVMVEMENQSKDSLTILLERCSTLNRLTRITAWMNRFLINLRCKKSKRMKGPLSNEEMKSSVKFWMQRIQKQFSKTENYLEITNRLNLEENNDGV